MLFTTFISYVNKKKCHNGGVQQSPNDMNIQSIVAAVINNLNGLPSPANQRSANSLEYRFINEQDELRNAFVIPRNANGDRVVEPDSAESVSQDAGASSASSVTALSSRYSRLQNYGDVRFRKRKDKTQTRSSYTGRFEKKAVNGIQGQEKKTASNDRSIKDLCLLPFPEYVNVPRLKAKAKLIDQGLYIDAWPFDKNATEEELRNSIKQIFRERLISEDDEVVG